MGGTTASDPGGDDDRLGVEDARTDIDPLGTGDPAAFLEDGDPTLLVAGDPLRVVMAGDHVVAVRREFRPLERGSHDSRRPRRLALELGGTQERLRRDAAPVRALAPDDVLLEERDLESLLGECVQRDLTAGARADDDGVEALAHRLRLARSS